MEGVNRNGKMKGKGAVAKLIILISVYEFPLFILLLLFKVLQPRMVKE